MKDMKVKHLKTGWTDNDFEHRLNSIIREMAHTGYEYYDIKVSSGENNCLVIFKSLEDDPEILLEAPVIVEKISE